MSAGMTDIEFESMLIVSKKALKLLDGYRGQGGYIVIGRIPNSERFDCYHVSGVTERASYDLSSSESEKLVILRLDLRDEIWWKDNPEYDPDYRLDRLENLVCEAYEESK